MRKTVLMPCCSLYTPQGKEQDSLSCVSAEGDSTSQERVAEDNALQRLQHPSPVLVIDRP